MTTTAADVKRAHARIAKAEADLAAVVQRARDDGMSWAEIAATLGVTRQWVWRKYGH